MAYRRTLFDRLGPGAADYFNAFRGAFIAGGLFGTYGGARYASEHGFNPVLGGLIGAVGVGVVTWFAIIGVSKVAGSSFSAFIQPQGTYVTNRLIDLYTGPLDDTEAAISELRRLIATHPSSDAAKHARTALVNLKRQLRTESEG